jgi:prepilin-type N-terminal cleavage/methylation domain-containing protein
MGFAMNAFAHNMIPATTHRGFTRGFTLVELMIALAVMAVISTAVATLLVGADNSNRYTTNQSTAIWETDFGWHRIYANGMAAVPAASGGMTPTVTTDANGQSRLTIIVPDVANATTRTVVYYCTGVGAPFTLVESDPRYNVGGVPSTLVHNVTTFAVTLDATTTEKIWTTLNVTPVNGWPVQRHFCTQCRNF